MIQFVYLCEKGPHFAPLCSECGKPVTDPFQANLEIDESCLGTQTNDSRVYHLSCTPDRDWFPWIRLSDALYDLLDIHPKYRKQT